MGRMKLGVDDTIKFVESTHQYFDKDGNEYESVTTSLRKLQLPFDREGISRRMAASIAAQGGISVDKAQADILSEWDRKRDSSIDRGVSIHSALENYLLKGTVDNRYISVIDEIKNIVSSAYRYYPEVILYDSTYRRAGQSDLVLQRHKGSTSFYDFFDYKTNEARGIEFDSTRIKDGEVKHINKRFLPPFDYLEDCNYNLYSLQLNLYAYFAVRTYGVKVGRLGIIFIDNNLNATVFPVMYVPSFTKMVLKHLEKMKDLPPVKDNW